MTQRSAESSQFVRQLDAKRRALGLDNRSFAAYLTTHGVPTSPATWSRIQNEQRPGRPGWVKGVCRLWPDLAGYVAADLLSDVPRVAVPA